MTEIVFSIASALILGSYWFFIAPRLERAPKWFKVPFIIFGLALIIGLALLLLVGVWAKSY